MLGVCSRKMKNKPNLFVVATNKRSIIGFEKRLANEFQVYRTEKGGNGAINEINKIQPDVAIVDVPANYEKGPKFIGRIRERFPDLPILAITRHGQNKVDNYISTLRCICKGANGYIIREGYYDPDKIKKAIYELINGGTYPNNPDLVSRVEGLGNFMENLKKLTMQECSILVLLSMETLQNKEIAKIQHRSVRTIEVHLNKIYRKLDLSNKELIKYTNLYVYGFMTNAGL